MDATPEAYEAQSGHRLFGFMSKPLIDGLATYCAGKNVLEVFAGRGQLSALLAERGVSVKATSLRQGHDASDVLGFAYDVEELDVQSAIQSYKDWLDVLLVCWPTTSQALHDSLYLLPDVPIVFIGEVTNYSLSPPFLGGCATDEFFDAVAEDQSQKIPYPTLRCDQLKVYRKKQARLEALSSSCGGYQ